MILHYSNYISEKAIYDLLLESKVVFSKNFINLLNRMKSNELASNLLRLYSKNLDVQYNFIDTTEEKDTVSFTPDRKAQELIDERPEEWKIINTGRFLTHGPRNRKIFKMLGYDPGDLDEPWHPEEGTIGTIEAESISPTSGNIFVKFKFIEDGVEKFTCLNKQAIEITDPAEYAKIWATSRNNIKIGRLIRSILTVAEIKFTDKEIENFINQYKATFDFTKDLLKQFDIVKGDDISHWYSNENYVDGGGTLNGSCMADVDSDYFEIYTKNNQVSLVILYGDEGEISDDKYTDTKIKGRALLWDAVIDGQPVKFMDRIYTVNDSDSELFKQFAAKNGWWYKRSQNSSPDEDIIGPNIRKSDAKIIVKLENPSTAQFGEFDLYPYLDTMCYLRGNTLTNYPTHKCWVLKETDGGYYKYDNDDDEEDLEDLSIDELEDMIQDAIRNEDYERASEIRDEINSRKGDEPEVEPNPTWGFTEKSITKNMKHLLKFNEEFEFPKGRQENTKNTILDVFRDMDLDIPDIEIDVYIGESSYNLTIKIPELLNRNEIHQFYDEIIEPKLNYLKSQNIKCKKEELFMRFATKIGIAGSSFKNYKYMSYRLYDDKVRIDIEFKRF